MQPTVDASGTAQSAAPTGAHVWMYWEDLPGRSCPAYLRLCQESIRHHLGPSMTLHMLDRESVFDWLPDLDASVWHGLAVPAQRADYARTRLTFRHGGLWVDADCIAVGSLDRITAYLADHDLVAWGADVQGRFFNNLFAARPGAPMLAQWIEGQDRVLATSEDWGRLPWAALGSGPVYPFLDNADYGNVPAPKVAPVLWFAWRRFLSPFQSPATVLSSDPVTVMLWNKEMGPVLGARSATEVLKSRMLLSRLLRIGLGTSTLADELDALTRASGLSDLRYGPIGRTIESRLRHLGRGAPAEEVPSAAPPRGPEPPEA